MKFLTDHFYTIGSSHELCEDFATSGIVMGVPYAIVCDGCSSSPGDVTTGSRILAYGVKTAITEIAVQNDLGPNTFLNIEEILKYHTKKAIDDAMKLYNLSLEDFLCTIEAVFIVGNYIHNWSYGDGCHISVTDGITTCVDIEFSSNAPYYFVYDQFYRNDCSRESYEKYFDKYPIMRRINFERNVMESTASRSRNETHIDKFHRWSYTQTAIYKEDFLAVTSDGIKSFSRKDIVEKRPDGSNVFAVNSIPESPYDVAEEIVNIKNKTSGFLQRRMTKYLKTLGISHYDDIGVACILIDRS